MNGLYIGASGMLNGMRLIEVNSNNIANANTTGFKFDTMTSSVYSNFDTKANYNNDEYSIGGMENKVVPTETYVNMTQGTLQITNTNTDFYLNDSMTAGDDTTFFVVERDGQQYLTRDGHFTINEDGYLVTDSGDFVLGSNNERVQLESDKFTVASNGQLVDANGNPLSQIQTRSVSAEQSLSLVKEADGRFTLYGTEISELPTGEGSVLNGMLEMSNVNMAEQMTDLMINQKLVSSSQKVMTTFDKIYEKESNNLLG